MWKEKLSNPQVLVGGVALGSLVTGSVLGYLVASKRLSAKYESILQQEIADVKRNYALIRKDGVKLDEAAAQYKDILEGAKYVQVHPLLDPIIDDGSEESKRLIEEGEALAEKIVAADKEIEEEENNIFEGDAESFDYEKEYKRREEHPNDPYVITEDEFNDADRDYEQVTLTFFEGDGVLTDSRDSVIEDSDKTVGDENMSKFGYGSNNKNVVYIRNNRLSIDIEVLRSDGKYAEEVLGFIEHADKPRPRKFRDYDE